MLDVFGFEVDQSAELSIVTDQLEVAAHVLWAELAETDLACLIFDAHVTSELEHSCLGCNLNEAVHDLTEFLRADIPDVSPRLRLHLALDLVNVVWERITNVCETLKVPEQLWRGNERQFQTFKLARRWANFMKHPGFFGLGIHHPIYVADGSPTAKLATDAQLKRVVSSQEEWVLISDNFVEEHWSDDHTGAKLRARLRQPFTACVILPDLGLMALGLCAEFAGFVERMREPTWVELAREHAVTELPCDWWDGVEIDEDDASRGTATSSR
jgi:hypothetical protein